MARPSVPHKPLSQAEALGKAVAELASRNPKTTPLERLRALSAVEVEKLVVEFEKRFPGVDSSFTADGWVLRESPQRAFLSGSIQTVDLMIGLNGREFSAFRLAAADQDVGSGTQKEGFRSTLKRFSDAARPYFGTWTTPAMALYVANILRHRDTGVDQAVNDIVGACPTGAVAVLTSDAGQHVYGYRFERSIPGTGEQGLGSFHGLEAPYVLGALRDPAWHWLPFTSDDAPLSNLLQTYWTNFAKSGNPNAPGLPDWPLWSNEKQEFLVIQKDGTITAQRSFPPLFSCLSPDNLRKSFK